MSEIESSLEATLVCALGFDKEFKAVTLERVKNATMNDEKLTKLKEYMCNPDYSNQLLPDDLSEFNRYRERLSTIGGNILYDNRLLIPEELRPEILGGCILHTREWWV